jgi:hypothetical protein
MSSAAPEGADLGLGCGNPQAIAALRPGETVLDLGSRGGFDCFLARAEFAEVDVRYWLSHAVGGRASRLFGVRTKRHL